MIQEKDFLYRVPVKNALVTAPGKQVRNPEILVDLEGGEFMHGDILDANSTNKLIDQSVKDAIDNSIENGNYVTKDLLEAETSARTKSDEDLNAKIKAEQTRAEGKEKEISEALNQQVDTLNAAISAKQDAGSYVPYDQTVTSRYRIDKDLMIDNSKGSAVLSTYSISAFSNSNTEIQINPDGITMRDNYNTIRLNGTGIILPNGDYDHVLTSNGSTINMANYLKESDVSGQFAAKADRSDLITLEQKVTANTTAIEGKQDEGNYVTYSSEDSDNYYFHKGFTSSVPFAVDDSDGNEVEYGINGITSSNHSNCLATSDGTFKPISDFASADDVSSLRVGLSKKQGKITVNSVDVTDIETADITKLRTIVIDLIDALSASDLIRTNSNLE